MKRLTIYLFASILFGSFSFAQQKETRSLASFSEISVSEAIEVELIRGNKEEAVVEVDGTDLEDIVTEVRGDRLEIEMRDRERYTYRNVDVKVYLTYREIEEIDVSSAADVYSKDILSTDELDIEVSSAGDVDLEIDVEVLDVKVSSAGDVELSGKAKRQFVKVSSSGDYDAYDLVSEDADVDASSSGDAMIYVSGTLEADASSAGKVYYKGDPERVYADSSSGGKVRKS